jgi:Ca2+-binding EF-hand superfamily protein
VLLNLRSCHQPHYLHYEMLFFFTQFLDSTDINSIRETFQHLDTDNSGSIEIEELKKAYEQLNALSE